MGNEQTDTPKLAKLSLMQTAMIQVITLRVALEKTSPPIWRRIQLTEDMTLNDLHYAIQGAFGWDDSHLHMFTIKGRGQYSSRRASWDGDFEADTDDSHKVSLGALVKEQVKKFRYIYDFGDSWTHEVKIEKVEMMAEKLKSPRCIDGALCGPPEDCGGIYGFFNFKEIMADRKHPEYKDMKDWYGKTFDPKKFNVAEANKNIRQQLDWEAR
jgi:hypothetical protein